MKKLLGVLLAIVMSWPVGATVLNNVEVKGEIQTIASDVRHQIDNADGVPQYNSGAWTRAMAGLSADLVEDVTANILFQYGYEWGTNNKDGIGFGASGDNEVRLVNANVALHNLLCAFDLTVGRQFYGDEDSAVMYFGPNHYNAEVGMYAQALDAAKLVYSDDVKTFTLLAGKIADSGMDEAGDYFTAGNEYDVEAAIMGADFKLNITNDLMAQAYIYNLNNMRVVDQDGVELTQERDNANMGFYGAKVAFAPEAFRVSAEYARNYGGHRLIKEHNPTGHMVKADIAADIKAVTARGTFLYANEGFYAFGNYTPGLLVGHKLGGAIWNYTDDGVRMFNLGFDVKPAEKWTVSLDGYAFQSSRGHHAATWEADLTAKYSHNEYVQLFAGIGYAKYGNEATEMFSKADDSAARKDNVKGQLGMLIKF